MKQVFISVALSLMSSPLFAQSPPDSNILMFDLVAESRNGNRTLAITNAVEIATTSDYENQPFFLDKHTLVYTRFSEGNTDIWQWKEGTNSALTRSSESEYSPVLAAENTYSAVRVEEDGKQRLWLYRPEQGFEVVFEDIAPVGYYAWSRGSMSKGNIAMFILGEPHTLQVASINNQSPTIIDEDIGRCVQPIPWSDDISYSVNTEGGQLLKSYNFARKQKTDLFHLPENTQDYAWLDSATVISSNGRSLLWRYATSPDKSQWQLMRNKSGTSLKGITRLAISPDKSKIAVVLDVESD